MDTSDILLGVTLRWKKKTKKKKQPCGGLVSHPGGVAILLGLLHSKETGILALAIWAFGSCAPLHFFSVQTRYLK